MLTQEQKEQRKIGCSDIGTILGLNPKKTPLVLYLEKIGQMTDEFPDDENLPDFIRFGNYMEATIAREYARRHGVKLRRVNQVMQSEKYEWLTGIPDRLIIGEQKGLECKNTYAFNKDFGSEFVDDVPESHLVQCQGYMMLTGYREWDLAVCMGGNKYREYTIKYSERLEAIIAERCAEFWRRVQDRNPPEATTVDDARLLYPHGLLAKTMDLSPDFAAKVQAIAGLNAEVKALEAQADALKLEVMSAMQDAEVAVMDGVPYCSWKNQTATRLDTTRIKAEAPEIYKQFSKESESRVFRLGKGAK